MGTIALLSWVLVASPDLWQLKMSPGIPWGETFSPGETLMSTKIF